MSVPIASYFQCYHHFTRHLVESFSFFDTSFISEIMLATGRTLPCASTVPHGIGHPHAGPCPSGHSLDLATTGMCLTYSAQQLRKRKPRGTKKLWQRVGSTRPSGTEELTAEQVRALVTFRCSSHKFSFSPRQILKKSPKLRQPGLKCRHQNLPPEMPPTFNFRHLTPRWVWQLCYVEAVDVFTFCPFLSTPNSAKMRPYRI